MTRRALRELRLAVRANPAAAAFLLSVLTTAPEAVIRKPLAQMLLLPDTFSASHFDDGWMAGEVSKSDLAAGLAVLLGADEAPTRGAWVSVAGFGAADPPGNLLPRPGPPTPPAVADESL